MDKQFVTCGDGAIVLEFVRFDKDAVAASLMLDDLTGDHLKDKVLAKLGLERECGESHLACWARHLHAINQRPYVAGARWDAAIGAAVQSSMDAFRFMFFLS